jgi:hypothetical protein
MSAEAETPLARLSQAQRGQPPFLEAHHVTAGEHIRVLVERAGMSARVTMSYAWTTRPSGPRSGAVDVSDVGLDARRRLAKILSSLPRDCAGVVLDACGLLKGLQLIETERGWPRRSAKLVLRIGLDQVARQLGLESSAQGKHSSSIDGWMSERPDRFE